MFDVTAYFERIVYQGGSAPTLNTLKALHRAHLLSVPFENLDIHRNQKIILDESSLFDKVVIRRQGGFCYELNGIFAALLRTLGYQVTLLSAEVTLSLNDVSPPFDHLTLLVHLDERWLVDVGFGNAFGEPLRLDSRDEQIVAGESFRIALDNPYHVYWRRDDGGKWIQQYRFTDTPRQLADFAAMCHFHQTSPDSHFTQGRIVTRTTPDGRVTLTDKLLIVTANGQRREEPIIGDTAFAAALVEYFDLKF